MSEHDGAAIDVVFLDVGGVIYDDTVYRRALLLALRDLGASVGDDAFDREYEHCRDLQGGSFRRRLAAAFLSGGTLDERTEALRRGASGYWSYTPEALEADVLPALGILKRRYRLGIIANQPSDVRAALQRDGIDAFLDVWGVETARDSGDRGQVPPGQGPGRTGTRVGGPVRTQILWVPSGPQLPRCDRRDLHRLPGPAGQAGNGLALSPPAPLLPAKTSCRAAR